MKRKSIYKIAINLWKRRFQAVCDSKVSPFWRKKDLKGFVRQMGVHTADWMIYEVAQEIAYRESGCKGWSVEFSNFFTENEEHFRELAIDIIYQQTQEELTDALQESMEAEIEAMYS